MSKYFIKEPEQEIKLSEHIKNVDKQEEAYIRHIMQYIGDVSLSQDKIKHFYSFLRTFGGRYTVRTEPETIKGLYEIIKTYPDLNGMAIEKIGSTYINDLFEKYSLIPMLDKFIKILGKTDDAFDMYIKYINLKADELEKYYIEEAEKLKEYEDEYGEKFIKRFMGLIKEKHYTFDQIEKNLPSASLIKEDEELVLDMSRRFRIYMGACYPISYSMVEKYMKDRDLSIYPEQPTYTINIGIPAPQEIPTKYTKTDFIESIKTRQESKNQNKHI